MQSLETFPNGTTDTRQPIPTAEHKRWVSTRRYKHNATTDTWSVRSDWTTFELDFQQGDKGATGRRGIGEYVRYITGSQWNNTEANLAVENNPLAGDRVTLFNNIDYTETRYWDGSIWNDAEQKIVNGALIVNVAAIIPEIFANEITVSQSVLAENGDKRALMSATGDYAFLASRGGTAVFAVGGTNDIVDGVALKSKSVKATIL